MTKEVRKEMPAVTLRDRDYTIDLHDTEHWFDSKSQRKKVADLVLDLPSKNDEEVRSLSKFSWFIRGDGTYFPVKKLEGLVSDNNHAVLVNLINACNEGGNALNRWINEQRV